MVYTRDAVAPPPRRPPRGDLWKSFVKEGEIIEKGWITVAERPGLGVEMDEEAARRVQIKGTPWFEPTA